MPEKSDQLKPGSAATTREELESLFKARYDEGSDWAEQQHSEFRKDIDYYRLEQWSDSDKAYANERNYPPLTLPVSWSLINAVSSNEIVNRFEPKYLPRSPEDQDLADKTTAIARYIRQQAGAEFEDTGAFRDMVVCGVGVTEWFFNETIGESGRIQVARVPVEEIIWDPASRKQNLQDSRWLIRGRWISLDDYRVMFPDADLPETAEGATGANSQSSMYMWGRGTKKVLDSPIGYTGARARKGFYVPDRRSVLVFEMQDWITETEWAVLDEQTGETLTLDDEQYRELTRISREAESGIPVATPRRKRTYRRTFFSGFDLVAEEEMPFDLFNYLFLTGFEDQRPEGMQWFGMMKPLRDPQNIANKGFSQIIHILSTNPKGVILHETGVFEDPQKAEINWSRPSGMVEVRAGALSNGEIRIEKGEYPADMERITEFSLGAVYRVSGIDPTFLGSSAGSGGDLRRVSGTALSQVLQQGQMMLSIPFDSLRRYRMDQGRLLLSLMRTFLPERESIRILGDASSGATPQFVEFIRDELDDVSFDLVVGDIPISPSQQEELWRSLTDSGALQPMIENGLVTPKMIARIMPNIPEDVRQEMIQNAEAQEQAMQQQQQAMMMQGGGEPPQGGMPPMPVQ